MKYSIVFIFSLAVLLPGCSSTNQAPKQSNSTALRFATPNQIPEIVIPDVPKATWEPIFFEAIDERAKIAGIENLRKLRLDSDEIEVRVWAGFGLTRLIGFILARKGSEWSALHLDYVWKGENPGHRTLKLSEPPSGWQQTWDSLLRHKLLALPDSSSIKCEANYEDGFSYVVEIKKGKDYRTYMYDNPMAHFENRCAEADEILAIAKIINNDFGASGFYSDASHR